METKTNRIAVFVFLGKNWKTASDDLWFGKYTDVPEGDDIVKFIASRIEKDSDVIARMPLMPAGKRIRGEQCVVVSSNHTHYAIPRKVLFP